MSDYIYYCTDCGSPFAGPAARKQHWKDTNCQFGHGTREIDNTPAFNEELSIEGRVAAFEMMADDLPDGAYFAMMEEFGVSVEDLMEHGETEVIQVDDN